VTVAAGKRDRKIEFERATVTTEAGSGIETETFVSLTFAWAQVFFGTGSERREAAAAGGVQTATFRCLSNSALRGVTRRDRILFAGAKWGISAISQVGAQGHELEFTATVRSE
jgi:SPP1 family predicted phage head-tail adaptor